MYPFPAYLVQATARGKGSKGERESTRICIELLERGRCAACICAAKKGRRRRKVELRRVGGEGVEKVRIAYTLTDQVRE